VEFAAASVAKVAADTMDNYLMFGHILKCKLVPQDQIHEQLWKGANRRFKKTPWTRIEKKRLEAGKTRDKWSKKIKQEEEKRAAQAEKMKALGYEFETPKLKSVDEVPVKEKEANLIDAGHRDTRGVELEGLHEVKFPEDAKEPGSEKKTANGTVKMAKKDERISKPVEGSNTDGGQQSQVKAALNVTDVPKTESKKPKKDAAKDTVAATPKKEGKAGEEGRSSKVKKRPAGKLEKETKKSKTKKTKA
jgi:nucleolar protein 15